MRGGELSLGCGHCSWTDDMAAKRRSDHPLSSAEPLLGDGRRGCSPDLADELLGGRPGKVSNRTTVDFQDDRITPRNALQQLQALEMPT